MLRDEEIRTPPIALLFWQGADVVEAQARKWLTEHVSNLVQSQGIDWYREDMNGGGPLPAWRRNNAPDRQGMTENLYVQGHLAFWDTLRRRHPGLRIGVYPTAFGWFGWCSDEMLGQPEISADRRTWVYSHVGVAKIPTLVGRTRWRGRRWIAQPLRPEIGQPLGAFPMEPRDAAEHIAAVGAGRFDQDRHVSHDAHHPPPAHRPPRVPRKKCRFFGEMCKMPR